MIAHVSIGVKNVDRSKRFYDAALQALGYRCLRPAKTSVGYGYGADSIFFWILSAERPRFQQMKSRVCTFALQPRIPLPLTHFTRQHFTLAERTMARPLCGRDMLLITMPLLSSIPTDIGSRRITVRAKGDGRETSGELSGRRQRSARRPDNKNQAISPVERTGDYPASVMRRRGVAARALQRLRYSVTAKAG